MKWKLSLSLYKLYKSESKINSWKMLLNFHQDIFSWYFLSNSICTFFSETRYNTSKSDCILQGDLSNSKSIWHLSLKFDALWCRVCSAKIRAIFPANYFSKPGVQINFSVMTNPRKLSLLCCCRSSRLTWRPEARRYKRSLNLKDKF